MKSKILNTAIIFCSLLGYLQWGKDQHMYLFQMEVELIRKMFIDPISVLHPFTLLPLFGQLLLFITLWQKQVSKRLTYLGIGCLGLLLLLIFIIGCMGLNLKIMLSAVPFILMAIVTILYHQKSNTSFPCG